MPQSLEIWRYGVAMCPCMIKTLPMIEARLRGLGLIRHDLAGMIYQGCWNNTVAASAGTHSGGGAIDVHPSLATTAGLRAWRESGVAMWHRSRIPGLWGEHAHGIWIGCPHLAPAAQNQVIDYRQHRNGLANNGPDTGPRVTYTTWQHAWSDWLASQPLKAPDYLQEVLDMNQSEFEQSMARAVRKGLIDFVKTDKVFGSPMPAESDSHKKNPEWTLASIVRYSAAWGRERNISLGRLVDFFTKGAKK